MNTTINLRGLIHKVEKRGGTRVDGTTWEVRTVVLWESVQKHDGTTFEKYVAVDFMKPDVVKILDANIYRLGDEVEVRAEVSSREVRGNWWTGLRGSDIHEPYAKTTPTDGNTGAVAQSVAPAVATNPEEVFNAPEQEEMPF